MEKPSDQLSGTPDNETTKGLVTLLEETIEKIPDYRKYPISLKIVYY